MFQTVDNEIKNALLSHKKQEAHLVENCRKLYAKKNSARPIMNQYKQIIASNFSSRFAGGLILQVRPQSIMPEALKIFL